MKINLWIPGDPVLGAIAPLGLGASAGTALVVDADPSGPNYQGSESLASLVSAGPRRVDLSPSRQGLAVLRNGGVSVGEAADVLSALETGWPHLVVRYAGTEPPPVPSISVIADLPGALARRVSGPTVVQRVRFGTASIEGDVQLPRPSTRLIRTLLNGCLPGRSRWVKAWKPVWDLVR